MSKQISGNVSYLSAKGVAEGEDCLDIFHLAEAQGFGELYMKLDTATGLKAIIAIHSTNLGPALGGTRCVPYRSTNIAVHDAMRLARGMSYKSAFFNLPYGGGKGVLIRPAKIQDRQTYFESYGDFIDTLGGRFITAVDSGTTVTDMDVIARRTRYVVSTSRGHGDPSPYTAKGVCLGIAAGVKALYGKDDLTGVRVAIQGVGNVGYRLARELHQRGARLTVCDINPVAAQRCAQEFGASVVSNDQIYGTDCDVFSPCALGGVINDDTIDMLKARIVCGAANNQLEDYRHGVTLYQKGILYAPDYVANAGGLMHAVPGDQADLEDQVTGIHDALVDLFQRSKRSGEPTHVIADRIAESVLNHSVKNEAGRGI
ncbi:MAG: Glu/Leu/Phe/Val dehydrogenase dimerization domain-containing protein [Pseudomonadota bacterium]